MKTLSFYSSLLTLFLSVLFLTNCSTSAGYFRNEEIKESKRNDLHELNAKVFELMKTGKNKELEDLISRELYNNPNFYAQTGNIGHRMVMDSFARFDEYYVVNKYMGQDTIGSSATKDNAYNLIYPAYAQEMYFAFYAPEKVVNAEMLTATFAKYDYGWKLAALNISKYTFNNKTAPELYNEAKASYDYGYLTDALNKMTLAITCLTPSNIWQYNADKDMRDFYNKIVDEANKKYKLPLVVEKVSTKPRIIGFYNKTTNEGAFPIISYLTHIPLKDTAGISYEKVQISKALDGIMPGLNKNNKYVYYLAYNQSPSSEANVPRIEMVDKRR